MAAIDRFIEHDWPGNIRELENVLTRAVVLSKDDCLHETNVANLLRQPQPPQSTASQLKSLSEIEAQHITQVLDYCQWNISQAARIQGIARPTLRNKIKSLKLKLSCGL
ncbi:MAG: helix-turn-helix domain-containing protein [Pseudomonadota bacterium]|nr:helix-turn-helix domain-containing protein [Pseudomonadota bacterium]